MARNRTRSAGNYSTTITIERDDVEFDVEVSAHVTAGDPGRTSGDPEFCYPPTRGEVDGIEATRDGVPFELTDAEAEHASDALKEVAADDDSSQCVSGRDDDADFDAHKNGDYDRD